MRHLRAVLYAALIVYASLFPFAGWRRTHDGVFEFLFLVPDFHLNRSDALTNLLAYVPLGLFLARSLRRYRPASQLALATVAGGLLSFAMEFLQQFIPGRVASIEDLMTNAAGCFVGAAFGVLTRFDVPATSSLVRLRDQWIGNARGEEMGLVALGLWWLSQWMPLVPSLDVGELRQHLSPLWHTLLDLRRFDALRYAAYACNVAGLAYLTRGLGRDKRLVAAFAAIAIVAIFGKVAFYGRVLSLEAAIGALTGIVIAAPAFVVGMRACRVIAAVFLLAGIAASELRPEPIGGLSPFAWVPFGSHLESPLSGMGAFVETLWPAIALAYLVRSFFGSRPSAAAASIGGILLTLFVFVLEWNQQFLRGRVGDVTPALIFGAAWTLTWLEMRSRSEVNAPGRERSHLIRHPAPRGDA